MLIDRILQIVPCCLHITSTVMCAHAPADPFLVHLHFWSICVLTACVAFHCIHGFDSMYMSIMMLCVIGFCPKTQTTFVNCPEHAQVFAPVVDKSVLPVLQAWSSSAVATEELTSSAAYVTEQFTTAPLWRFQTAVTPWHNTCLALSQHKKCNHAIS